MKKLLFFTFMIVFIVSLSYLGTNNHAAAFNPFRPSNGDTTVCDQTNANGDQSAVCTADGTKNPVTGSDGLITRGANIFAVVTGVAAVVVILISGFEYVRSSGESAKIEKAKNGILFAVIGLVVIILARSIVALMISKLG